MLRRFRLALQHAQATKKVAKKRQAKAATVLWSKSRRSVTGFGEREERKDAQPGANRVRDVDVDVLNVVEVLRK